MVKSVYLKIDEFEEKYFSVLSDRSHLYLYLKKFQAKRLILNKVMKKYDSLYELPIIDICHQIVPRLSHKLKLK